MGAIGQAVVGNAVSNVAAAFGLGPVAALGLGIAAANAVGTPAAANNASVSDVGVDAANAPAVANAVSQGTVAESSLGGLGDAGSGGVSAADGTDGSSAGPGGSSGDAAAAAAGAGPGGPGGGDGASAGGGGGDGEARGGLSPYFNYHMANGGLSALAAGGAAYNLGGYSDGGRLLKGPGDGVSDSIPATIANKQPARLADGEFVIPARIVSELGNGSTDAGARQLYKMMDRIQAARRKTTGKNKVATNSRAAKHLPA